MNLLELPLIDETRRNHAIEHATIHILHERFPNRNMGGHSNPTGFFIVGDLPTEAVREAVSEALARLQRGERHLAIHPGCGTNYLVSGALAGVFAYIGMMGTKNSRERFERLPLIILLSALGLIIGQPLGPELQKQVTTQPDPGGMVLEDVYRVSANLHRVVTRA